MLATRKSRELVIKESWAFWFIKGLQDGLLSVLTFYVGLTSLDTPPVCLILAGVPDILDVSRWYCNLVQQSCTNFGPLAAILTPQFLGPELNLFLALWFKLVFCCWDREGVACRLSGWVQQFKYVWDIVIICFFWLLVGLVDWWKTVLLSKWNSAAATVSILRPRSVFVATSMPPFSVSIANIYMSTKLKFFPPWGA